MRQFDAEKNEFATIWGLLVYESEHRNALQLQRRRTDEKRRRGNVKSVTFY